MLILTYKIIFGFTDMNPGDFFTFASSNHSNRGHAYKLVFFVHTIATAVLMCVKVFCSSLG